jgi:class 3 adenylate cyclase
MEISTRNLYDKGGQIRQFIHDDKGTVCIGTIGLRGSTTKDNAAAAVEAAKGILGQLQALGFDASVGIASGKAFCGLVGSDLRHEYAVMGPSVNLSARLMGAADMGI